ncbi:hypothetical protein FACS189432_06810 [Bacteroidia bacterium]|nr:hypothetical protein FACS189426_10610 [Bacteroidia bacterium]GHT28624.1 hypothetical protein FACS189432_06810 [Bacteroidia bacterium]
MYKQLFILLFNLIASPVKTWEGLAEEQDTNNENFHKSYLYPIIGIIALLSFLGVLAYLKNFDLQIALKTVIKVTIVYFAGFYLEAYCLFRILPKYFGQEVKMYICERFTGYSSAVVYTVAMVAALFPALFFIQIFIFYAVYLIWLGATHYLQIKEEYLTKFTIFASILILFSPLLIQWLISLLMPGLKL